MRTLGLQRICSDPPRICSDKPWTAVIRNLSPSTRQCGSFAPTVQPRPPQSCHAPVVTRLLQSVEVGPPLCISLQGSPLHNHFASILDGRKVKHPRAARIVAHSSLQRKEKSRELCYNFFLLGRQACSRSRGSAAERAVYQSFIDCGDGARGNG